MKTRFFSSLAVGAALVFGTACDDDSTTPVTPEAVDLVSTAEAAGTFNTLIAALEATDLRVTLETGGPFTVFAPTDAAFDALPAGTLEALLADPDALAEILLYHVVDGALGSSGVASSSLIPTLNGQAVTIAQDGSLTVDGAGIVAADVSATNGVIHIIDQVLLPVDHDVVEIAVADDTFSTLVFALGEASLVSTLQADGPFTVFAPTNAAFEAVPADTLNAILADVDLLTQVLTYHVVAGRVLSPDVVALSEAETLNGGAIAISVDGATVRVDDATVIQTDVQGTNGVIHIIDHVLLPPDLVIP